MTIPTTGQPADRRAHPRRPVVVREARCLSGAEVFFGCAGNVSRGGLFISSVRLRPRDCVYELRFELPGLSRTFQCKARVVWSRPYESGSRLPPGFGLQFLDLPEEERALIDAWVCGHAG